MENIKQSLLESIADWIDSDEIQSQILFKYISKRLRKKGVDFNIS